MRFRRIVLAVAAGLLAVQGTSYGASNPTLTGVASGGGSIGGSERGYLENSATLSGSTTATGSITFRLFGPSQPACLGTPLSTTTKPVAGDGVYRADGHTPTTLGTYRWTASYSGDSQNTAVATTCGEPSQTSTVTIATPAIVTTASQSVAVGGAIFDTARLSGTSDNRTGSVTFTLYGPDDPTCTRAVASSAVPMPPFGDRVVSEPYTTSQAGLYRWIAAYSGDAFNAPAQGSCSEAGESVLVTSAGTTTPTRPSLSLRSTRPVSVGDPVTVTAGLATVGSAIGTMTFRFYGPDDLGCTRGTVATSSRAVLGSGDYSSDPFVPSTSGTYNVIVAYAGNDGSAASTTCADAAASFGATALPPPKPELADTFTVEGVEGTIYVKASDRTTSRAATPPFGFVEVRDAETFPMGSTVDASNGIAKITTAVARTKFQTGRFSGTRFTVKQTKTGKGLTELDLSASGKDRRRCRQASSLRAHLRAKPRKKLSKRQLAKLRSKVKGRFRTRGRYSKTTVHGTEWLTIERCDGTLTRVLSGTVKVTDTHRKASKVVRKGGSYLAKAG